MFACVGSEFLGQLESDHMLTITGITHEKKCDSSLSLPTSKKLHRLSWKPWARELWALEDQNNDTD